MTPNSYFFRVEHDLLRSDAFKTLGGSAIKVYLVIGLYSDFGTDWAFPSIRTIASQAGLSRQTVLVAIEQLAQMGLLATNKAKGRSTAYRIIRQAPRRPTRSASTTAKRGEHPGKSGPILLGGSPETGLDCLDDAPSAGLKYGPATAQATGPPGHEDRPKQEHVKRETEDTTSIPIPGTPFRLTAQGRLLVAVDLQELLTNQGIPGQLAQRLVAQKDPEAVAKVLLNAFYLQSQGKLHNGPGYIRAGIEDGYDLLPQVASRLEVRRRELEAQVRRIELQKRQTREAHDEAADEAAITYVLEHLGPMEISRLLDQAILLLPKPLVRRNPTLSNPFVRAKVYELACGEPKD
jgi:hypothetical protein